jgi:adenylate cyclase
LISPLRALRAPGRVPALLIIVLAAVIRVWDPAPLRELQYRVFDLQQWAFPRSGPGAASPVRIVQIDQDSIAKHGQWPWPRTLVARLVKRIGAGQPRVLGIDILFAEPDRTSPPLLAEQDTDLPQPIREALAQLPSNDSRLAEAIRSAPTVLGMGLADPKPVDGRSPSGSAEPEAGLPEYATAVRSLPEIARAARAQGSLTVEPDEDGIFRRLHLAVRHQGATVPGFALAVLSVGFDAPFRGLRSAPDGIEAVIGPNYLAAEPDGAAWVYFGEPSDAYSAAEVMDQAFDLAALNDKIVLLAVTGLGKVDLQRTPLGLRYGIEFHAQLIDSILSEKRLFQPAVAFWIELIAVLLGGVAMIWLLRYERPLWAGSGAAAAIVLFLGGEFALFRFAGWLVDGVYPAIATLAAFGAMLQGSQRAAQTARRAAEAERQAAEAEQRRLEIEQLRLEADLQHEREDRARTHGELTAARTIQLGLLPHRFPAFPERGDIDIYARIEPAREIGGDLFDYFFIDRDRLFFFIGDVSGKGPAAALFMVMTKEVVRDAAGRHGAALERLLGDANDRIAAASGDFSEQGGDMVFVTAFAGIANLASGEIAYASAGHDSPFVISPGRALRQFETEGGPPLGAVEDFAFPVDRDRLEPGEFLLLYTDGVTEAQDRTGALYSAERLVALLATVTAATAEEVVQRVFDDVRSFAGEAEQADDITLLVLRRPAPAG